MWQVILLGHGLHIYTPLGRIVKLKTNKTEEMWSAIERWKPSSRKFKVLSSINSFMRATVILLMYVCTLDTQVDQNLSRQDGRNRKAGPRNTKFGPLNNNKHTTTIIQMIQ